MQLHALLAGYLKSSASRADENKDRLRRIMSGEPAITPEKVEKLAALLLDQLHHGPPELRQAYARLAMKEVSVSDKEIRITGSKAVLARAAAQDLGKTPPGVLSFVREWRPRQDLNLRPSD